MHKIHILEVCLLSLRNIFVHSVLCRPWLWGHKCSSKPPTGMRAWEEGQEAPGQLRGHSRKRTERRLTPPASQVWWPSADPGTT